MSDYTASASSTGARVGNYIWTIPASGILAVAVWEVWARLLAPLWIGGPLEPAGLVESVFGVGDRATAEAIHFATGIIAYPFAYVLVVRPLSKLILPFLPWWVIALCYGAVLWAVALYGLAHHVAGMPPFLGFGDLTWASLVGHLVFGLTLGAVVNARLE
jgi:hypothetical protein